MDFLENDIAAFGELIEELNKRLGVGQVRRVKSLPDDGYVEHARVLLRAGEYAAQRCIRAKPVGSNERCLPYVTFPGSAHTCQN